MQHRHLDHQQFTLAAIDDMISRRKWDDWAALRQAVLADSALLEKVAGVCLIHSTDHYSQRYHFWLNYVEKHRSPWASP